MSLAYHSPLAMMIRVDVRGFTVVRQTLTLVEKTPVIATIASMIAIDLPLGGMLYPGSS